jgi:hypothetical protein
MKNNQPQRTQRTQSVPGFFISALSALLSVRIIACREDFGVRWQPAEAKRSEDWSAAATPLFDCEQSFQSGVAPALRDSRRSPKRFGCGFAALCPFAPWRLCVFALKR